MDKRTRRAVGHAILAGILAEERSLMLGAIGDAEWRISGEDTEKAWWSVLLERL